MNDESPAGLLARLDTMKTDRAVFDSHWQEVADYVLPSREFTAKSAAGSKRGRKIYNTTPVLANDQLASGLHGGTTSPALRWCKVLPGDAEDAQDDDVRATFDVVTDRLFDRWSAPSAGLHTALHEGFLDIGAFGNCCIFMPKTPRGVSFQAVPLAKCFIDEDEHGFVDTLFRLYTQPGRIVLKKWSDKLSDQRRDAIMKNPAAPLEILHATWPAGVGDGRHWRTCWVLVADKVELQHGSFDSFPFAYARWKKRSGEKYGTGQGMDALPDIKMLNLMEETQLRAWRRTALPPIMVPDDGFLDAISLAPEAINHFRPGTPGIDLARPLVTGVNLDMNEQRIRLVEERIKAIFYVPWMNMPQQPNMTATEVLQRRDELMRLMASMVARLFAELHGPIVDRSFNVEAELGRLPKLPANMRAGSYRVEYVGPLAQAQKTADAESVMRTFAAAGQLAQYEPSVILELDANEAMRFVADRLGAPARIVRSAEQAAAARQEMADRQAEQHNMQAAIATAKTAAGAADAFATLRAASGVPGGGQVPA